jgi:hypothetical protein
MLSDPLAVTYDSTAFNLYRTTHRFPGVKAVLGRAAFRDSTDEIGAFTSISLLGDGSTRSELLLVRENLDPDPDPLIGVRMTNGVGLVFQADPMRQNTAVDIPLLLAALVDLVDSSVYTRLIGGEH